MKLEVNEFKSEAVRLSFSPTSGIGAGWLGTI